MIIDKKKFGNFLAKQRLAVGISQLNLAREIGYSSPQYVSNWERAICGPPIDKLAAICKILKIDPQFITDMILNDVREHLMVELKLGKKTKSNR